MLRKNTNKKTAMHFRNTVNQVSMALLTSTIWRHPYKCKYTDYITRCKPLVTKLIWQCSPVPVYNDSKHIAKANQEFLKTKKLNVLHFHLISTQQNMRSVVKCKTACRKTLKQAWQSITENNFQMEFQIL